MALTRKQQEDMLKELFDSEKVNLICSKHFYCGPVKHKPEIVPMLGCPDCWKIFYIYEMASTPPDKRREKLEELEEVLHHVVEMVEAGTWDLKLYDHAQIEIGTE